MTHVPAPAIRISIVEKVVALSENIVWLVKDFLSARSSALSGQCLAVSAALLLSYSSGRMRRVVVEKTTAAMHQRVAWLPANLMAGVPATAASSSGTEVVSLDKMAG
jgi:hypothetical protein